MLAPKKRREHEAPANPTFPNTGEMWATHVRCLRPHVSCIQASGDGGVGGAFDDGAAVGEERHLVWVVPELEHELIVLHLSVRSEAARDFFEVDGTLAFVDLNGVASAHGNVGAADTSEVNEVALLAGTAAGARVGCGNLRKLVNPDIVGEQGAAEPVAGADDQLDCLGGCDGRDEVYG